mmetsp:Transcript_54117/g.61934  ORF Transcript_54117/g.61934 Transcript_54117/m.61934 type:complete len:111 (-) Transcript_54117:2755-3087(-)
MKDPRYEDERYFFLFHVQCFSDVNSLFLPFPFFLFPLLYILLSNIYLREDLESFSTETTHDQFISRFLSTHVRISSLSLSPSSTLIVKNLRGPVSFSTNSNGSEEKRSKV